jgi:uncharacterized membrane protein YhaH (DUF805 family)
MTGRQSRLARATFWLVFLQAVVVIVLLAVTLNDVADRAAVNTRINEQLETLAEENQQLILKNAELTQTVLCVLTLRVETPETIQACLAN